MNLFRRTFPCLAAFVSLGVLVTLAAHAQVREASKTPSTPAIPQASDNSDDGAIKEAESAQKVVQQKEEQLLKLLQEIAESTRDIEPGNLPKEQKALEGFKKLLPLLKERSAWLLNKQEDFSKNMQLYQAALEKTPRAFLRAAEVYGKFAADEDDLFFKEQYLDMAQRSKKLAAAMEVRAKGVKNVQVEVAQKLRFVEKSVVFLNRLGDFLAIYDPASGKSAEVDSYLKQLDAYIAHFYQSISAFKQLSDTIQNGTASPVPGSVERDASRLQ
jgi:hypothetical protein